MALWFAKENDNDYVTIFDIDNDNKHKEYICPVCSSKVIPKCIKEDRQKSPHFAHRDASKCNTESLIHWCYKNNFLVSGGEFKIEDRENKIFHTYVCAEVLVEQQYKVGDKIYKPDVTVITTSGETIYFEMNYKNKKKIEDYVSIWLELNKTVVEIDVKNLLQLNQNVNVFSFKPIFFNGKCYGKTSKKSKVLEDIIQLKENVYIKKSNAIARKFVKNFDWLWRDIANYKLNKTNIEDLFYSLDYLVDKSDEEEFELIEDILTKSKCSNVLKNYFEYKQKIVEKFMLELFDNTDISNWYKFGINNNCVNITTVDKNSYDNKYFHFNELSVDLMMENINKYVSDRSILESFIKKYIERNIKFKYPTLSEDKRVYLSVDNRDYNKQYGKYKNLSRFNFIQAIEKLEIIRDKIDIVLEKKIEALMQNVDKYKTFRYIRTIAENKDINKEIERVLYPLLYTINNTESEVVNIILNAHFTKDNDGRTRRWLIEDFLKILNDFGMKIKNHNDNYLRRCI